MFYMLSNANKSQVHEVCVQQIKLKQWCHCIPSINKTPIMEKI
jgi:hypothetical protein